MLIQQEKLVVALRPRSCQAYKVLYCTKAALGRSPGAGRAGSDPQRHPRREKMANMSTHAPQQTPSDSQRNRQSLVTQDTTCCTVTLVERGWASIYCILCSMYFTSLDRPRTDAGMTDIYYTNGAQGYQ